MLLRGPLELQSANMALLKQSSFVHRNQCGHVPTLHLEGLLHGIVDARLDPRLPRLLVLALHKTYGRECAIA